MYVEDQKYLAILTCLASVLQQAGESGQIISWPDLPIGFVSPHVTVIPFPDGVWILYQPVESDTKAAKVDAYRDKWLATRKGRPPERPSSDSTD